jgi:hypothetical protein
VDLVVEVEHTLQHQDIQHQHFREEQEHNQLLMFPLHQVHSFHSTEILVELVEQIHRELVGVELEQLEVLLEELAMVQVEQDNHSPHLLLH